MNNPLKVYDEMVAKIQKSYQEGTTMEAAERLAGEFLFAQIQVTAALQTFDLDARMRRSGVKAIKSGVRQAEIAKFDKKPTEGQLDDVVNTSPIVQAEQNALDQAEVDRDALERYYNVFREAHIFYRGLAKGNF